MNRGRKTALKYYIFFTLQSNLSILY